MAAFNWTAKRLKQLESAVRGYNRVTKIMNASGRYDIVYAPISAANVKSKVTDYNSFRRAISGLNRFSVSKHSKKGFELVETPTGRHWLPKVSKMADNKLFPKQEKTRYVRAQRSYNKYVDELFKKYNVIDGEWQRAFGYIDSDLAPVPVGSSKVSPAMLEYMKGKSAIPYFESYAEMWLEGGGDYVVADIIYFLIENYPDALEVFRHVPDERIEIEWVYKIFFVWGDDSKRKTEKAKERALDRKAEEESRGVRFWQDLYDEITGEEWTRYGEEGDEID